GCVESMEQVRRKCERDSLLRCIIAQVKVAREIVAVALQLVVVEHHGNAGIGAEAFSASAGRQMNAAQIDGESAEGTDGVDAELEIDLAAKCFEAVYVVKHAGRGFAVGAPNPPAADIAQDGF